MSLDPRAFAPFDDPLTTPSARQRLFKRARSGALKAAFALAVAIAGWWLVWMVTQPARGHQVGGMPWAQNILVPVGILAVVSLVVIRHERHWAAPLRKLTELLDKAGAGEAPIEELSCVRGGLSGIVPHVQRLLRELKQQKLALAELNEEIRLRVATRTDALERKIGSLREQAVRDALTGLYNRRMFDQLLPQLVEKCRTENNELCLMMMDVDHFKLLNDTRGHAVGDELLRDIGRLIRSGVREHDAACRLGGDEFVLLLPGVDRAAAQLLADRLVSLVDGLARSLRVERKPRLSIGLAMLSELENPSAPELIERADKLLYEVKTSRNTTRSAAVAT